MDILDSLKGLFSQRLKQLWAKWFEKKKKKKKNTLKQTVWMIMGNGLRKLQQMLQKSQFCSCGRGFCQWEPNTPFPSLSPAKKGNGSCCVKMRVETGTKSLKVVDGAVKLATATQSREENVHKQQQKSLMNSLWTLFPIHGIKVGVCPAPGASSLLQLRLGSPPKHAGIVMETPFLDFKCFKVGAQLLTKEIPENKGIVTRDLPQTPCRCTWHFHEGGDTWKLPLITLKLKLGREHSATRSTS